MEKTLGKMTFSASTHISESRSSRIRTYSTVAAGPPSVKEVCLTSKLESSNHFHLELLLKKARRSKVNQPPRALFILRQKNFFSFSLSLSLSLAFSVNKFSSFLPFLSINGLYFFPSRAVPIRSLSQSSASVVFFSFFQSTRI